MNLRDKRGEASKEVGCCVRQGVSPTKELPTYDSVSHGTGLQVVKMNDITKVEVDKVGFFDNQPNNVKA